MELILYLVLLFSAIVGILHILSVIEQWLVNTNTPIGSIIIIPISGHMEEIEMLAREFRAKYKHIAKSNLLFVDMGMDKETRNICETFCADHADVLLCDDCQVRSLLKSSLVSR